MTPNDRTISFLITRGIPLREQNTVVTDLDDSCDMAQVSVNGEAVMVGNTWDFHPGCHGFDLPAFKGPKALSQLFVTALKARGHDVIETTNHEWVYED